MKARRPRSLFIALVALAVAALACTLGRVELPTPSRPDDSAPRLQPDGPLHGLVLTSAPIDAETSLNPRLSFTTQDTQAIAVVTLGADVPAGSTLTIHWFRVAGDDGHEFLFSHEISVGPRGRAFSQGSAPDGLAPGLYETVATLGDWQVVTPWVVHVADVAIVDEESQASAAEAPSDEDWNVPDSGDSGWYEAESPAAAQPPEEPTVCTLNGPFTDWEPLFYVRGKVNWSGPCEPVVLSVAASGPPTLLATSEGLDEPATMLWALMDMCDVPGGSDMPGTAFQFSVTAGAGETAADTLILPDFGKSITAGVVSVPSPDSRVDAGVRIALEAKGMVIPPALGLQVLNLDDGSSLIGSTGNFSGSQEPEACDLGRFFAKMRTEYRVPDDPPPVVEICATAKGFDGNENRECIQFYVGEVWEGTLISVSNVASPPGPDGAVNQCRGRYLTTLKFGISEDGVIEGRAMSEPRSNVLCTEYSEEAVPIPWLLSGTRSDTGLTIQMTLSPGWTPGLEAGMSTLMESPIAALLTGEASAAATWTSHQETLGVYGSGYIDLEHTLNLRCVSCD